MPSVVFNATAFKARYPEFAAISDARLGVFFGEAGLYLSNADNSPVQNIDRRATLLNMLTAHIAYLGGALSADGLPKPVGRVSQATEGSVSASLEYLTPGTHAWFTQTQYGAAFWQATSSLRGMRYVPCPTRY
jgi:hypothetical protein